MFTQKASEFNARLLRKAAPDIKRGIEKEGLRVTPHNNIAQTPHPTALGSTLTHPSITTDYSEALLEFITPALSDAQACIQFLRDIHAYSVRNISNERIWPASMPCLLQGDLSIPIANYGTSNIGTMKHVYRQGLGVRYGRIMQSIAGIHYNFSVSDQFWQAYQQERGATGNLQDFKSAQYFCLIRNVKRNSWLLHYLFGASPVVDRSFLEDQVHSLEAITLQTYGLPYATSLRMSDLGYQNSAQEGVTVSYDSLADYIETLGHVVKQSHPEFEKLGVKVDGVYRQLNSNLLQLENEFYSDVRPKRVANSGEKPLQALQRGGVEYIEVRVLDINPFLTVGIDEQQAAFMDAFLMYCLLSCDASNPTLCSQRQAEIKQNQRNVITRGRDPSLQLVNEGISEPLATVATRLLDQIMTIASLMDETEKGEKHQAAVTAQHAKVEDSSLTPSGQMMSLIHDGGEFINIAEQQANEYKQQWLDHNLDPAFSEMMEEQARQSIQAQKNIEDSDSVSFDDYLAAYHQN